jgi:predicted ABC-type transport system involved in lysophospholipase L1 biosynthesis ATPase subunit
MLQHAFATALIVRLGKAEQHVPAHLDGGAAQAVAFVY